MRRDVRHVASVLASELGPLRRAMSRVARAAEGLPDLPENQIEVLRAVTADPGLTTQAVATRLRLARPTVSNLVNAMRRDGLLDLLRQADDARLVQVYATEHARTLLQRYDAASSAGIAAALEQLDASDVSAIRAALPALARLSHALSADVAPPPS